MESTTSSSKVYRRVPATSLDEPSSRREDDVKKETKSKLQKWSENILWLAIGVLTWKYANVGDTIWDPKVQGGPFYAGVLGYGLFLGVFCYLQYYLPRVKGAKVDFRRWEDTIKRPIHLATFGGVVGLVSWLWAFWPVWGFRTPFVLMGLFMGIITLLGFL